jgi:hypothetical protein
MAQKRTNMFRALLNVPKIKEFCSTGKYFQASKGRGWSNDIKMTIFTENILLSPFTLDRF